MLRFGGSSPSNYLSLKWHIILRFSGTSWSGLGGIGCSGLSTINSFNISHTITIANSNAETIHLEFEGCHQSYAFNKINCCRIEDLPGPGGSSNTATTDDLYYQQMTYEGIDIVRIDLSSDCNSGKMRNDFTYDMDHRIKTMNNQLFNPESTDAYSTSYTYYPSGNIRTLSRRGLVDIQQGTPTYALIDNLKYYYSNERLSGVQDLTGLPQGYKTTSFFNVNSDYDNAGNITHDPGKGLNIAYNILNLPRRVTKGHDINNCPVSP